MPKREDIKSVLVIGSGPIVIGQACEFDYSGTQACRVLKEEGLRVILVNSNPATIMTDPEFADATYVEPITAEYVEKVIAHERPDAMLATLGGQTALNTAIALAEGGVLGKYGVELIGASIEAIHRGENRESFKRIVEELGGEVARSAICHSMEDCLEAARRDEFYFFDEDQKGYLRSMVAYYVDEVCAKDGTLCKAALVIDTDAPPEEQLDQAMAQLQDSMPQFGALALITLVT